MEIPVRVEVSEGSTVVLEWDDGSVSTWSAGDLRRACTCADCARLRQRRVIRLDGGGPPTVRAAEPVGAYGVQFTFGPDDHRTGIYRWDRLHTT